MLLENDMFPNVFHGCFPLQWLYANFRIEIGVADLEYKLTSTNLNAYTGGTFQIHTVIPQRQLTFEMKDCH